MAQYNELLDFIKAVIYTNHRQAITGDILQETLVKMVGVQGYQFAGVATPDTQPGNPDPNTFYLANQAGTYSGFGNAVLDGTTITVFMYDGSWKRTDLPAGLIKKVYSSASLGGTFSDTNLNDTFNAFTINAINSRLVKVEGNYVTIDTPQTVKALKTFEQGIKIGNISIVPDPESGGIKVDGGLFTTSWLSCVGVNPNAGGESIIASLADLSDVALTNPQNGQILQFSGGNWVNATLPPSEVLKFTQTGAGNVVTSVVKVGTDVTVTKGLTALTADALTNLVTTNTKQDISGEKTFNGTSGYVTYFSVPSGGAYLGFNSAGSTKAFAGLLASGNVGIGHSSGARIGVTAAGVPYFSATVSGAENTLIHSGNIASYLTNYVTLNTAQTIPGKKTFSDICIVNIPEQPNLKYFLGIEQFSDGGTVKWIQAKDVCNAVGAVTLGTEQTITATKKVSRLNFGDSYAIYADSYLRFYNGSGTIVFAKSEFGTDDGIKETISMGRASSRWSNVYSVAGNFSGDVTANRLYITGSKGATGSYIYSDSLNNIFMTSGGISLVLNSQDMVVRSSNAAAGTVDLGSSSVRWKTLYTTAANISANTTSKTLTISSTAQEGHLIFSRASANYIMAPTDGAFAFVPNGGAAAGSGISLYLAKDGSVAIGNGTNARNAKFHVVGDIYASAGMWSDGYVSCLGVNITSDQRLKETIREASITLDQLVKAPAVVFRWKSSGQLDVGSFAQYWKPIVPEAVKADKTGRLSMSYGNIALTAVINLAKVVKTHEERIAELERKYNDIKGRIAA